MMTDRSLDTPWTEAPTGTPSRWTVRLVAAAGLFALMAAGGLLWAHEGMAVFAEVLLAGLSACL